MASSYDSLSTNALHAIARMCGAAGRAQLARDAHEAQAAAREAETRRAVEAAQVRAAVQAGDYADDSDALWTPQELQRLAFTRWRLKSERTHDGDTTTQAE